MSATGGGGVVMGTWGMVCEASADAATAASSSPLLSVSASPSLKGDTYESSILNDEQKLLDCKFLY